LRFCRICQYARRSISSSSFFGSSNRSSAVPAGRRASTPCSGPRRAGRRGSWSLAPMGRFSSDIVSVGSLGGWGGGASEQREHAEGGQRADELAEDRAAARFLDHDQVV